MKMEGILMNTIAERIKFAMKVKNKKQIEIVRDTGISKGAFSSYLSGQYNPKLDKLQLKRRKCTYADRNAEYRYRTAVSLLQ